MFKRFDKITVWYKKDEKYSRYEKGRLKDQGETGIVFIPEKGGHEIWNPLLSNLYIESREGQ